MGETVGVRGVEVTEGVRVGVAEASGVSCRGGLEGPGGFKLHAETRRSINIKEKYRITKSLLTLGPARFDCTLTLLRERHGSFLIHDRAGPVPGRVYGEITSFLPTR